jgi:ABC-2 type transport system ATP-binding protein
MITCDEVIKRYDGAPALDGLSLAVRAGEIFGLLGPNGAGKSTLMHLLVGLLAPDSGSVRVLDGDPRDAAIRARIGFAPQSLALYMDLTARENLRFFARISGVPRARRDGCVDAALEFVRLADRADQRVSAFSGGMQRRLNIACAIVHEPAVVLLDEPTVGVDPQSRNAIFDNVLALRARGTTVVYTTHYMEEAERLCDRIAVVDHGRLLALDTAAGLVAAHGGAPVLVVRDADGTERTIETATPLATLNERAANGTLSEFRLERPRLEHVFLHLTGRSLRD